MHSAAAKTSARRPLGTDGLILILAGFVALNALFLAWNTAKKQPGVDFLVFWSVAQAVSSDAVADIYSPEGRAALTDRIAAAAADPAATPRQRDASQQVLDYEKESVDVVATPFLFSVLSLWEHGDYRDDLRAFTLTCLVLFTVAMLALSRAFGWTPLAGALFLTLFCVGFGAFASDLRVANVNQIQLASMALLLWMLRRPGLYRDLGAGAFLGLSVMFRPSVALAAALLIVGLLVTGGAGRAARVLAGGFAGGLAAVGISALYFGSPACWSSWLRIAPSLIAAKDDRGKGGLDYGNYGLVAAVRHLVSADISYVVLLVLLAAFGWSVWQARRRTAVLLGDDDDPGYFPAAVAVSLGLVFVLLSAQLVWFHYLLLGIPAVLLALAATFGRQAEWVPFGAQVAALGGSVCLLEFPVAALGLPTVLRVAVLAGGLLTVAAVLLWALATGTRRPVPA